MTASQAGPRIPTAEEEVLKTFQCQFESDRGHQVIRSLTCGLVLERGWVRVSAGRSALLGRYGLHAVSRRTTAVHSGPRNIDSPVDAPCLNGDPA